MVIQNPLKLLHPVMNELTLKGRIPHDTISTKRPPKKNKKKKKKQNIMIENPKHKRAIGRTSSSSGLPSF